MSGTKDFTDQSGSFSDKQFASVTGSHTGSILTTMLKQSQSVIELLVYRFVAGYANDAAHAVKPVLPNGK